MKYLLIVISICAVCFSACTSSGNKETVSSEVPLYGSDLKKENQQPQTPLTDTIVQGPFNKEVSFQRTDDNGGFEEYRLKMNFYEGNIPHKNGELCYGILSLYIKTPENTEGVEVARRIITNVVSIEAETAQLTMSDNEERPQNFAATITYNPKDYTYKLQMEANPTLEDLIENNITLQ